MPISYPRTGHAITGAIFLPAILALAPCSTAIAQGAPTSLVQAQPTFRTAAKTPATPADRVAIRISDLHNKLRITPDQEGPWSDVAQVMRDNETKMQSHIAARSAKIRVMNAVEDLRSYQMITDEHADGLKRLIPVFEALYEKMPAAQQKIADHVFDDHARHAARIN